MGFLVKVVFWLGLVLVLLPRAAEETETAVGTGEVLRTAGGIASDLAGMCERRPELCDTAGEILRVLGIRARDGAAIAYGAIAGSRSSGREAGPETGGNHPEEEAE